MQPLPPGPAISGETKYKPHSLVRLRAVGVPEKAGLLWRITPKGNVQRATTSRDICEFAAPPGAYEVEVLVISCKPDGSLDTSEAAVSIVIESCHPPEPGPKPPTPPGPGPTPPPTPPGPGGGTHDPSNAIGRIQFGNAGCSATIVSPRRADGKWDVLTAAHCISSVGQTGTITMPKTGRKHAVKVKVFDRTCDIAWLETVEPISDIEYAHLGKENPPTGTKVWHQGYGFDKPRNREDGTLMGGENLAGQLRFVLNVSNGDSGGGIFRADTNEVISSVCCTAGIAQKTDMYGGSTARAIRLRPKSPADWEGFDEWTPIEIPAAPPVIPFPPLVR